MLEGTITPTSSKEIAEVWSKAVTDRNGAIQFSVFSHDLREKKNGTSLTLK
nr:hypothetical protein [Brevibacillus laterosporus]